MTHFPRCWVLPGGRLEPGESLESCAIRELKEEVGIEIKLGEDEACFYKGENLGKMKLFFAFEECVRDSDRKPITHHLILFF